MKEQVGCLANEKLIDVEPASQEEIDRFFQEEDYPNTNLDTTADIEAVMKDLNMGGGKQPRIRGMPLNQHLTNAQVLGIRDLIEFLEISNRQLET